MKILFILISLLLTPMATFAEAGTDSGGGGGECKKDFIETLHQVVEDMQSYSDFIFNDDENLFFEQFEKTFQRDFNYIPARSQYVRNYEAPSPLNFRYYDFSLLKQLFVINEDEENGNDAVNLRTVNKIKGCTQADSTTLCKREGERVIEIDCEGNNSWMKIKNQERKKALAFHEASYFFFANQDRNMALSESMMKSLSNGHISRPYPKEETVYSIQGPTFMRVKSRENDLFLRVGRSDVDSKAVLDSSEIYFFEGIPFFKMRLLNNTQQDIRYFAYRAECQMVGYIPFFAIKTKEVSKRFRSRIRMDISGCAED